MNKSSEDFNMNKSDVSSADFQFEISFFDIVNFVQNFWKKLALASILGAVLGFFSWFVMSSYSAENFILNNAKINTKSEPNGFDFLSWRAVEKSLPSLASKIVSEGKLPVGQAELYQSLRNSQWWAQNVTLDYLLSKTEVKNFASVNKEIDDPISPIISIRVKASGSSSQEAINNVEGIIQFIRSGAAYLQIENLLKTYEIDSIVELAEIQRKITGVKIEVDNQQKRIKFLEELFKRYPGSSSAGQEAYNNSQFNNKYASTLTSIVEANNDLFMYKENLNKLEARLTELIFAKEFLNEAYPKLQMTFDGQILSKELQEIIDKLSTKIDNPIKQAMLEEIRTNLLVIQTRFNKILEVNSLPISTGRKNKIQFIAGGLASGFLLALILLIGQRVLSSFQSKGVKSRLDYK
jgi:hypothetical protein